MSKAKKKTKKPLKSEGSRSPDLGRLAERVGDFIRYWGFRRIHGQIWTHLFLSQEPLTGTELVQRLRVSKALVSPALKELQKYKLILVSPGEDARSKKYTAAPQVLEVIRGILKQRESPLLNQIYSEFQTLKKHTNANGSPSDRWLQLETMIFSAKMALDLLVDVESFDELQKWVVPPTENA